MRHAPLKSLPQATLALALLYGAGYPLAARHAAPAAVAPTHGQTARPQQQPTPRPRVRPTPTPSPTPKRGGIQTTQDPTPTPTPTPTPKSGGGLSTGEKIAIGSILGAVVGGGIVVAKSGGVSSGDLSKNGPQFPSALTMSNIQVTGFADAGWPLFVGYELQQPALVTLTIKADKVDPFVQQLEGSPGAHELTLTIPARFDSKKPRVTSFSLTAVSDNPSAPAAPVEFVYVDICAGHKAVGSVGIDNVSFQPGDVQATAQSQKANYKFHSLFDFDKVTADFMLIGRNDKREIVAKRVGREKFDRGIKRDGWLGSDWDCRNGKKISQGRHQLQVRGWRGLEQGGDWVATMSKQFVRVR
ncbi:MAG: hypothetical protein QOD32_482 [Pyrinomonadaceae bacterium]|jgi:hypothetical protein|nr:hypothetical protein [Pyrinomonadaceae bacterium]